MNNKRKSDIISYATLFVAWVISGLNRKIHTETIILFASFLACCFIFILVKDVKVKSGVLTLIIAAASIYDYEFILLYHYLVYLYFSRMSSKKEN